MYALIWQTKILTKKTKFRTKIEYRLGCIKYNSRVYRRDVHFGLPVLKTEGSVGKIACGGLVICP